MLNLSKDMEKFHNEPCKYPDECIQGRRNSKNGDLEARTWVENSRNMA